MKFAPPFHAKEIEMKVRSLIVTAGVVVALIAPTAALAAASPAKRHTHRVLCICVDSTAAPARVVWTQELQQQFERQYDQDLIDHGLAPVYGYGA
jgi:hypothetical protein